MRNDLRCWYIMDASRYSALLFSILFLEHGRKDFKEVRQSSDKTDSIYSYSTPQIF